MSRQPVPDLLIWAELGRYYVPPYGDSSDGLRPARIEAFVRMLEAGVLDTVEARDLPTTSQVKQFVSLFPPLTSLAQVIRLLHAVQITQVRAFYKFFTEKASYPGDDEVAAKALVAIVEDQILALDSQELSERNVELEERLKLYAQEIEQVGRLLSLLAQNPKTYYRSLTQLGNLTARISQVRAEIVRQYAPAMNEIPQATARNVRAFYLQYAHGMHLNKQLIFKLVAEGYGESNVDAIKTGVAAIRRIVRTEHDGNLSPERVNILKTVFTDLPNTQGMQIDKNP